jgi:hypothetical protein
MKAFIEKLFRIAEKYGLQVSHVDATDVTLMAQLELFPGVFIQVYRNLKKDKLELTLVFGNQRIYGVDSEGGLIHEHPIEDPLSHVPYEFELEIDKFIQNCLTFLAKKDLL